MKGKRKKEQWREGGGEKVGERRRRRLGKAKWEGSSTIYCSFSG